MIAFISGTVSSYTADTIVLDHNGMGWQISYAHTDQIHLGESIKVYTYLHITENDMKLFGFESQEEKELFLQLISVKGLGPKTAMAMFSKGSASKIIGAIESGNVSYLKSMPGIGAKSASQIILDLKGRLVETENTQKKKESYSKEITEAMEGLKNFEFKPGEIAKAGQYMNEHPGLTTEEYIRMGLRFINKSKLGGNG